MTDTTEIVKWAVAKCLELRETLLLSPSRRFLLDWSIFMALGLSDHLIGGTPRFCGIGGCICIITEFALAVGIVTVQLFLQIRALFYPGRDIDCLISKKVEGTRRSFFDLPVCDQDGYTQRHLLSPRWTNGYRDESRD